MHQDLNYTLEDFILLKKSFSEEQKCNSELKASIENLQKQNKEINNILKLEGSKRSSEQETAMKEQKNNALVLELKGENLKLSKQVKELEIIISDLKMEKMKLEKHCTDLKLGSSKELEDTKINYETKIQEIEKQLNKQLLELNKKLDDGAHHKRDELEKLEQRLIAKESENLHIQKKATADVAIYQKKMLSLEHLCNELQKQRQEAMHPLSGPVMRHQQLPTSTSANDQIPSADGTFQYHPSPRSTAFLCSPADFQPDTTSATPTPQNKQPRGRSRPNISKRNIVPPKSTVTLSKVPSDALNAVVETNTVTKTTRFSMAKKRKLFSANQNTL